MKQVLFSMLALLLGLASGYVYFRVNDLMLPALLALAVAMAFGLAQPRTPWLWALLVALSIPAAGLVSRSRDLPVEPSQFKSVAVVALASAFLGSYAGAITRRVMANIFSQKV